MKTAIIIATGPSMSQAIADYAIGKGLVIVVSDAYKLAPKADALVSSDAAWWAANPEALAFEGEKYSAADVKGVTRETTLGTGSNSGLLAMLIAHKKGAERILLCGFDMHGSHYFGKHPEGLKNTTAARFEVFKNQFARWKPKGVTISNCTVGSALRCYPFADLKEQLEGFKC